MSSPVHIGRTIRNARVGLCENGLATLMHTCQPDLEPLFAVLGSQLSPADLGEVRRIAADLRQRIERFRRSGN